VVIDGKNEKKTEKRKEKSVCYKPCEFYLSSRSKAEFMGVFNLVDE
jgi:hypothetical protein